MVYEPKKHSVHKKNPSTVAVRDLDDPLTLTKIASTGRDSTHVHSTEHVCTCMHSTEDYKK